MTADVHFRVIGTRTICNINLFNHLQVSEHNGYAYTNPSDEYDETIGRMVALTKATALMRKPICKAIRREYRRLNTLFSQPTSFSLRIGG